MRVHWVDTAKGVAILLVVIYHAAVLGLGAGMVDGVWERIDAALTAFRMPLFFFASGLFAQSVTSRPWPNLWTSRLALLVWMFAVWTVLRFVAFLAMPTPARPWETDSWFLVIAPIWPTSGLWFLHALIVFIVLAKLIRPVPPAVQIGVAAAMSALFFSVIDTGNLSYNGMGSYFVFFLVGLHFRDVALRLNDRPRPGTTVAALVAFGVLLGVVDVLDANDYFGVGTVLGLVAVGGGVLAARLLDSTPLRRPLRYLGANTLPIYVQHIVLIAAVYSALAFVLPDPPRVVTLILPILTGAIALPISLGIARAVRDVPALRYAFEVPRWFSGARAAISPARRE